MKIIALACSVLTLSLGMPLATYGAATESAQDFYKGKQITFIISTGAGGGYDAYGRLLARHIGSHIPGSPTVVPQNMPGAGGLRAANYMFNNAPRDGSTIALVHSQMTTISLYEPAKAKFDATKLNWIGSIEGENSLCISWHTSPIKTTADLLSKTFIVGGSGAGADNEIYPRVLNSILGTRIKIVSGYKGGKDLQLAMERGEVHGRCSWPLSSIRGTHSDWIQDHKLNFLLDMGLEKDPRIPGVPLVMDLVKSKNDRAVLDLILAPRNFLRPIFAPPGIPPARLTALRKAFADAVKDPAFLADAEKLHLLVKPTYGAAMQIAIAKLHHTPSEIVARSIEAMGIRK